MSYIPRLNNFIQKNEYSTIDRFSKIFIILEMLLGLNRMTALTKMKILQILSCFYSLAVIATVIFLSIVFSSEAPRDYIEYTKLFQFAVCGILGFASRKKIRDFYKELGNFDLDVGCKPKVSRESFLILLCLGLVCSFLLLTFAMSGNVQLVPVHYVYVIENLYFGLLFNLLFRRLRLINECLESTLISHNPYYVSRKINALVKVGPDGKTEQIAMDKLMDLYYNIIGAYDLLIDAIKWQLLFITVTSFIYTLCVSYEIAIHLLEFQGHPIEVTILDILLVGSEILPLTAPCLCCDVLRSEVHKLRELLASKLFESKLDKANRSVARALLALTKARNLSFALLRMVDISITLPFSYLGLLATYLIIMLQFEKVFHQKFESS